ncbi:MAG: hypothetical protein PHP44_09660 [Kiritimatiellae bacterium]|nr:hypothetical protein [Kiritimatiellia bacterium]
MSAIRKTGVVALVFALAVVQWTVAADSTGMANDEATDVAIEKKFSRSSSEEQGTSSGERSSMGAPQDAAKQGLLAQLLVMQTGLYRYLPANPTDLQCFEILNQNGIFPKDGWEPGKVVTRGDLARVIVLALELEDQVQNPDDPRSWMEVLASIGIQITTIGEAVNNVYPISEPKPADPFFGPAGANYAMGMDNIEVAYALRNVFPPVPRRPVTPD